VGAIVGGVVGGICGLALIVGGVIYWRRRQAAKAQVDQVSNPVYDATATGEYCLSLGVYANRGPLLGLYGCHSWACCLVHHHLVPTT
jgi:hypothetical protein